MQFSEEFVILAICLIPPLVLTELSDSFFSLIQYGEIPSDSCILKEFSPENSTESPEIQCGISCDADPDCVGMDILDLGTVVCRLLHGFPAFLPLLPTSSFKDSRYEKSKTSTIGKDFYCDIQLTNGPEISTVCHEGIYSWMLFQRRMDGSVNFWRNWTEYENGFGYKESEFWLGNRKIAELTSKGYSHLRIEMMDHDCIWKYAEYSTFAVDNEHKKYRMHVSGYNGTAGDSFSYHNGMYFSTYDNDNDASSSNCGQVRHGAWWYRACHKSNLNGEYDNTDYSDGINWYHWKGFYYSMKEVRMMLRKP